MVEVGVYGRVCCGRRQRFVAGSCSTMRTRRVALLRTEQVFLLNATVNSALQNLLIEIREECNMLGTIICACVAMVSSISSGVCGL